jgi:hypothetical protein
VTRATASELLAVPEALLTRSHLRELGLERRAVDAVFRALPVVSLPGYSRPLVRAADFLELVEASMYRGDRVRPVVQTSVIPTGQKPVGLQGRSGPTRAISASRLGIVTSSGVDEQTGAWEPAFKSQRPPFEPGNEVAVRHGAYAVLKLRPRADEIAGRLRAAMGDSYDVRWEAAVEVAALAAARVEASMGVLLDDETAAEALSRLDQMRAVGSGCTATRWSGCR